jgi:hypothetical protein
VAGGVVQRGLGRASEYSHEFSTRPVSAWSRLADLSIASGTCSFCFVDVGGRDGRLLPGDLRGAPADHVLNAERIDATNQAEPALLAPILTPPAQERTNARAKTVSRCATTEKFKSLHASVR